MRDRLGFVGLITVVALALPGAAHAAPAAKVKKQLFRPGATQPYFVAGELSAPRAAAPGVIARDYLATRPAVLGVDVATLAPARTIKLKRGHLVRFDQVKDGLVVMGGETAVRIDPAGRVRWVMSGARPLPAKLVTQPKLTAAEALERVANVSGFRPGSLGRVDPARATRLVILREPAMAEARLAYVVELPTDPIRMQKIRGFIDAETGFVYRRENLVKHQLADAGVPPAVTCPEEDFLAYVYETNPIEQEEQVCKSLAGNLDAEATTLANADVTLQNCIDENTCMYLTIPGMGSAWIHFCARHPVATINGDGDFTDYFFESDTAPEDPFAEVQMFYHVNKVYAVARALGDFTNLDQRPLTALVNVRIPSLDLGSLCQSETYTGSAALNAFDNAAFMPQDSIITGFPETDSIVFGQGTGADFSYDGDVIYHEFGHAVMFSIAPTLSGGFIDQYGLNTTPGGMHEGYADLMTMFVTDDPGMGEYAGGSLGLPGGIRDIDNDDTCPASLIGESHTDSLPITGAMWEARQAIATTPEQKTTFDEALFAAQESFGTYDDFQTAAAKTVTEIELAFDATAAGTAETIFASRGLDGCNNRIIEGSSKALLYVGGTDQVSGPTTVPGPIQFAYDLPVDAVSFEINIAASQAGGMGSLTGGTSTPALELVVKGGGDPILWTVEGATITGDYTASQAITIAATGGAGTASIAGSFPAGTYHLQIVNKGPTWALQNITLSHTPGDISPDAGPSPDADTTGGDGGGGDCGCVVDARSDHGAGLRGGALALLLFGGLFLVRRRR